VVLVGPDYDNLVVHSAGVLASDDGASVRYFVYELSQQTDADGTRTRFTKVVRLGRAGATGDLINVDLQRDLLSALHGAGVPVLCVRARLAGRVGLRLLGTQGIGATFLEAAAQADRNWELLSIQIAAQGRKGLTALGLDDGRALLDAQQSWLRIAMMRGRATTTSPGLTGGEGGSFVLSLVAWPVTPSEMTRAWENIILRYAQIRAGRESGYSVSTGVRVSLESDGTGSRDEGSFGVVGPSAIGGSASYSATEIVRTLLEAQVLRYQRGMEQGAFLYQAFLQAPNGEDLSAAGIEVMEAFLVEKTADFPAPLHVVGAFDEGEADRLVLHARGLTSDRRPESNPLMVEPFVYSTYVTLFELAALTR